jgi:arylsulfatase A-like enzyme
MALTVSPGSAQQPARPNVVVIMTDDQTLEQMRVMDATRALIGDAGVTFANSFVSFPICCPSRATFLTGQYAHNHGVMENEPPTGGYQVFKHENSLPVWLEQAGYRTIHVGKFLNGYGEDDPYEIPSGWTEWYGGVDPSTYRMWGYTLNENGTLNTYGSEETLLPEDYQTDVLAGKAVDVIERAAAEDEPFFLSFATLAPHREVTILAEQTGPRPAPRHAGVFDGETFARGPNFNEEDMSDKPLFMQVKPSLDEEDFAEIDQRYRWELESLLAVDEAVAAIVAALEAEGILDETYVIFTSDNGYFHGEHRTPDEKILAYESGSRVPLLMRGPGIPAGTVVEEFVANIDLAPTIVAVADATAGLAMDGRSLLPFVAEPQRRTLRPLVVESFMPVGSLLEFFLQQIPLPASHSVALPGPLGNIPLGNAVLPYQAVRTERYLYVEYVTGERELYDLVEDPWQMSSAHLDPRYLRTQLALLLTLEQFRLCAGEACRAEIAPIPDPS